MYTPELTWYERHIKSKGDNAVFNFQWFCTMVTATILGLLCYL